MYALENAYDMNKKSKKGEGIFLLSIKVVFIFTIGFATILAAFGMDLAYITVGIPTIWEGKI